MGTWLSPSLGLRPWGPPVHGTNSQVEHLEVGLTGLGMWGAMEREVKHLLPDRHPHFKLNATVL